MIVGMYRVESTGRVVMGWGWIFRVFGASARAGLEFMLVVREGQAGIRLGCRRREGLYEGDQGM